MFARGTFGGALVHTPNVYNFSVMLRMACILGGDALWVQNGEAVNLRDLWADNRADMLRMPGIIAYSAKRETLAMLCDLAKRWHPVRYRE
jgi:3'(2'), 5'-bisphosphate nucleotidase